MAQPRRHKNSGTWEDKQRTQTTTTKKNIQQSDSELLLIFETSSRTQETCCADDEDESRAGKLPIFPKNDENQRQGSSHKGEGGHGSLSPVHHVFFCHSSFTRHCCSCWFCCGGRAKWVVGAASAFGRRQGPSFHCSATAATATATKRFLSALQKKSESECVCVCVCVGKGWRAELEATTQQQFWFAWLLLLCVCLVVVCFVFACGLLCLLFAWTSEEG